MEPRIQYAKTSDGVSIAFWTLGEGLSLARGAKPDRRLVRYPTDRGPPYA